MTTYILGSDDPAALATFAQEVAPAVRVLVDAERARRAATPASSPGPAGDSATQGRVPAVRVAPSPRMSVQPTPDDGTRLASERAWEEGDRPAYDMPERGYSAQEEAVAQHLVDVHDHLRQELRQVRGIVEQVRAGALSVGVARSAINTMTMRQNNWTLGAYCAAYCRVLTGHHSLEDRGIFPHLRRAEPGLGPVIERLESEHEVIHDLLERLDEGLVGVVTADGSAPTLDELAGSLDVLTDALLSHLAYEERQLLAPLAAHGFG